MAHLGDSSSDDTPSAFTATVVINLPFRFGEKESELLPSLAFGQPNAFAAKDFLRKIDPFLEIFGLFCPFWAYSCTTSGSSSVAVGDAVTGGVKLTTGDYKTRI